jgi:hypothetical protein
MAALARERARAIVYTTHSTGWWRPPAPGTGRYGIDGSGRSPQRQDCSANLPGNQRPMDVAARRTIRRLRSDPDGFNLVTCEVTSRREATNHAGSMWHQP